MRIRESFRSSVKSLLHNKLRSFLTMLGIIIGIFSVIMLTSIGEGIKSQVTSQVESLGANLLYIYPGKVEIGPQKEESKLGVRQGGSGQGTNTLTYDDVLNLKGKEGIGAVSCIYSGIDWLDELKIYTSTTGVDEEHDKIHQFNLKYGRFFNKSERVKKERVAVIGDQANKELFHGRNSVGKVFKLNGNDYHVVGVLKYEKPENMGFQGEDLNVKIYLPVTEIIDRVKEKNVSQITVKAVSAGSVGTAEKTIKEIMLKHHRDIDFTVLKQQDMLNTINSILSIITAGLGGIAAISLLVGGIGIMNIMLVSVTERTREIGVRKAIGANRRDILVQFLIEAVFISIVGGLLGLATGVGGARLIPSVIPTIHTSISLTAVIIALLFAFLVGIFFGVYPASKAAKLDPIEALRSE